MSSSSSSWRGILASRLALGGLACAGLACGTSSQTPSVMTDGGLDPTHGDAAAEAAPEVAGDAATARSVGCGASPATALGKFVEQAEVVSGVAPAYAATYTNRSYWLRLPPGYDPTRAYPLVLIGNGCGQSGSTPIPIQNASRGDAILVGLQGVDDCFNVDAADTPELAYFDATVAALEASTCIDTSRVFVMGFSGGASLTNDLGCARGSVIRALGTVGGSLPPLPPTCTGPIPAMVVSDTDDVHNLPDTVRMALARVLAANGCGADTEPYDATVPSPCVAYKGCMPGFPVVWCLTSGQGHMDQGTTTMISTVGFWHFWTSLP